MLVSVVMAAFIQLKVHGLYTHLIARRKIQTTRENKFYVVWVPHCEKVTHHLAHPLKNN